MGEAKGYSGQGCVEGWAAIEMDKEPTREEVQRFFITSIAQHRRLLCRSAPHKAHVALVELRQKVRDATKWHQLESLGRDFDSLLVSAPYFRAAHRRWCKKHVWPLMKKALRTAGKLCAQIRQSQSATRR